MINLTLLMDLWSDYAIPAMTQVIEIVVWLLGIVIILGALYRYVRSGSWKRLFHRHNSMTPRKPTNHLKPTG